MNQFHESENQAINKATNQANYNAHLTGEPLTTLLGFDLETYQVPIDDLMPCKKVPDGVMSTRKYR